MSFGALKSNRVAKNTKSFVDADAEPFIPDSRDNAASGNSSTFVQADGLYGLPSCIEIRTSNGLGRGLYATRQINRGEVIISVKPHIACLSTQNLDFYCSACFNPPASSGQGLKKCSKCVVRYCGSTCQNSDWTIHKHECAALRKWAKAAPSVEHRVPNDAIRCLGRILWKRRSEGEQSNWTKEVDGLHSNRHSLPSSAAEIHTHLAHSVVQYLGATSPADLLEFNVRSVGDLVDVVSRFISNTFAIASPSLTPLGASVSPPIALTNHSCDPNAVIVFPRVSTNPTRDEPAMQLVAIRSISEGEQVFTSYIDTTSSTKVRRETLLETYTFDCQCSQCTSNLEVDPREALRCPRNCGGSAPFPVDEHSTSRCLKCKSVITNASAVLDALNVGQQGLDKASALQSSDPQQAVKLTSNLIPLLESAGLCPSAHPLLALTRLHQSLLTTLLSYNVTQDLLDETARIAMKNVSGLTAILTEGHPVRGIALAELGKILAVDEPMPRMPGSSAAAPVGSIPSGPPRLKVALETLVKARQELLIGFGSVNEGGEVGKDARQSIVSLEREIGVWKYGVNNLRATS